MTYLFVTGTTSFEEQVCFFFDDIEFIEKFFKVGAFCVLFKKFVKP